MAQIPMLPQFYIGEGVNSATGTVYGQAIDFSSPQPAATGQTIELALESVSSSRELTDKLSIGASASINLGLFSASAEFKLANASSINSYYTYALVRVVVQNPATVLRDPSLRPHARDLLTQRGWDEFSLAHGWEYIQGIITGGSYYALIEVQTSNEIEQREVKTKLSGSFGPFKADASFERALQEATKHSVVRVIVYQSGGSGDLIETDLEGMLAQARTFPQLVRDHPTPITAITADYRSTVPIPPGVPAFNSLVRMQQRDTLQSYGRAYLDLRDYKLTLEYILSQQRLTDFDDFREMEPAELISRRNAYRASLELASRELNAIAVRAQRCSEDYSACEAFVSTFERLPLPRKGGELMNLKNLEERVQQIQEQVGQTSVAIEQLTGGQRPFATIGLTNGGTLRGAGRFHITGEEILYLLNRSGVVIGKEWGGSGSLFVQGTSKLGSKSTEIRNLQLGQTVVGNSGGRIKSVVVPFHAAFDGTPIVVASVQGDGRRNLPDTFSLNLTSVTPGEFSANIGRVDAPGGWGQVLTVNWMAWE